MMLFHLLTATPSLHDILMIAQVLNARFYYAVQVYIPDEKMHYRWETIETFKSEGFAKEFRDKLLGEPEMTVNQIYKKYRTYLDRVN